MKDRAPQRKVKNDKNNVLQIKLADYAEEDFFKTLKQILRF